MPHKPGDETADAPDPGLSLHDLAAGNPDLLRLLDERDRLERRMQEIAAGSPGSFAPAHDNVRFPVAPLGQRRAQDARWAQARDESRSAAVQRIVDARRREAAAGVAQARREEQAAVAEVLDARIEQARQGVLAERWTARSPAAGSDWFALREQQAAEALAQARARTAEAADRALALERRIARARTERPQADWSEQRERRRVLALETARRQTAEAAAVEQALDERLARAREERLRENRLAQDSARAPHWSPPSSRDGLDAAPREPTRSLPPTAAERSLDERVARAQGPKARQRTAAATHEPQWVAPSDRRGFDAPPSAPSRSLVPTAAERSLDGRKSAERRPAPDRFTAPPPLRDLDAPAGRASGSAAPFARERPRAAAFSLDRDARQRLSILATTPSERPRIPPEASFDSRRDRVRDTLAQARKLERKALRAADHAAGLADKAATTARDANRRLGQITDGLRDFGGDALAARVDRLRAPLGKAAAVADKTGHRLKRGRAEVSAWQAARDRTAGFLGGRSSPRPGDLGGFNRANERKLGMDLGSVDDLTRLRDAARALWPERKKAEAPKPHKSPLDRLKDLDARRQRAIEKLKARRSDEKRDDQRRARGLAGLKARRDHFGAGGLDE